MLVLFLFLLGGSALAATASLEKPYYSLEDAEKYFEGFIKTNNKHYYSESEKRLRFEIFKQNLVEINQMNADPTQKYGVFGINSFSDLTKDEFISMYTGLKLDNVTLPSSKLVVDKSIAPPDSWDWRDHNAVTPVKNQQQCGSCWAFSTTGTLEGAYAIKHNELKSFSEQQLVDCSKPLGCNGSFPADALTYLQNVGGIEAEDQYPYTAKVGQCNFEQSYVVAQVTQIFTVDMSTDESIMQALQHGPISITLCPDSFHQWHGGILNCTQGRLSHAVLLVGYGTDEQGVAYWIIKNSWGTVFAEGGFVRVRREGNPCSMKNDHAVIPQVA